MSTDPVPLLIVEDDPAYADNLLRLLPVLGEDLRFVPKCVDTAEKAIEEIANMRYALVVLDDKLTATDGMAVLGHIRSLPTSRQPAVIMLTSVGNESAAAEAMKHGAKDYLPKDELDAPSLMRAISGALERKSLEQQVARYTEQLREKNAQVEADLTMAREMQEALLPERYPTFPRNVPTKDSALHFCHRYLPTGAVGGDFFDLLSISDTQAGVFICDVMGHGVRAALVTAMVRALAEELASAAGEPDKFLMQVNRRLLGILTQTRMPMFASAFYLVVDLAGGELRYSSAGHPSPLLVRRNPGTVEALRFSGSRPGPALGVFEESVYPISRCPVTPQDLVVLFTDGLYEVEGAEGDEYGQERLLAAVNKRTKLSAGDLFDELLADVQKHAGNRGFADDVCVVGVEVARVGSIEGGSRHEARL
jgi:sigma-B regulation protein RsbU (phosphoserine phosphatase)